MRVTRLELTNYKCFEHLVLDDLGDRVVLVGPNGCGKSAILEAIAVLKEYVATYDPNQARYSRPVPVAGHTTAWPAGVPLPVRGACSNATINLTVSLNPCEAAVLRGPTESQATVCISAPHGEVTHNLMHSQLAELFRRFDPGSGVGVFDYISPHRQMPARRVTTLDAAELSLEAQRRERIELGAPGGTTKKFAAVKQYIMAQQLSDTSARVSERIDRNSIQLLQELFADFFGPKELVGVEERDGEYQIVVDTPKGRHDIDLLSSGERELFTVFVNLFRIREFPSVVLYDEPERHLNPGLEARIIPALDKLQTRNQIWIATHAPELVSSVPMDQIIALPRLGAGTAPVRFVNGTKTDRYRLFEAIGAKVGLQLSANRVVFVEGKNAHADKRILERLVGPRLPGVVFVACGPSSDVMGAGTRGALLLEQASKDTSFMMVLDRDYRDEDQFGDLEKRLNGRALVWRVHEMENLLLDPVCLHAVLANSGLEGTFPAESDVGNALLGVAKGMAGRFAAELAAYRLHLKANPERTGSPKSDDDLRKMAQGKLERAQDAYATSNVDEVIKRASADVQTWLADGTWIELLPGKELLEEFRRLLVPGMGADTLREQVISEVLRSGSVHREIQRLCEFVQTK